MSKKEGNDMDDQQYITVKEFAQRAGVSIQSVYQSLNKRLKPYLKIVDNRKMLNIKALEEIYGISDVKEVEQSVEQENKVDVNELINILKAQIEIKDRQIAEKDRQIAEMQKLVDQEQQLSLKAQNRLENLEQKSNQDAVEPEPAGDQNQVEQVVKVEPEKQTEKPIKSMFERLKCFFN